MEATFVFLVRPIQRSLGVHVHSWQEWLAWDWGLE
jgi:hypothetical protein